MSPKAIIWGSWISMFVGWQLPLPRSAGSTTPFRASRTRHVTHRFVILFVAGFLIMNPDWCVELSASSDRLLY